MSESKCSTGPWSAVETVPGTWMVVDANGRAIAEVGRCDDPRETEANARRLADAGPRRDPVADCPDLAPGRCWSCARVTCERGYFTGPGLCREWVYATPAERDRYPHPTCSNCKAIDGCDFRRGRCGSFSTEPRR